MKNYLLDLLKNKQLSGKKIDICFSSGNIETFHFDTDSFDICSGERFIKFTKSQREYIANCDSVEMFIVS